ncbi:unnamed protein product [Linum trigynum]|uniref:Uncharacterized protein n=1 Tax=Linum trigynum TaxID=586398 RepID=A0AAV2D9P2_9ROSI
MMMPSSKGREGDADDIESVSDGSDGTTTIPSGDRKSVGAFALSERDTNTTSAGWMEDPWGATKFLRKPQWRQFIF